MLALLLEFVDLVLAVFADVVGGVIHAHDATVHGEERSVKPLRDRAIEVLALVFRHDEDDLSRVADTVVLTTIIVSTYTTIVSTYTTIVSTYTIIVSTYITIVSKYTHIVGTSMVQFKLHFRKSKTSQTPHNSHVRTYRTTHHKQLIWLPCSN